MSGQSACWGREERFLGESSRPAPAPVISFARHREGSGFWSWTNGPVGCVCVWNMIIQLCLSSSVVVGLGDPSWKWK